MATTENEYYIRAILLLVEGGSYISKKVLYREHFGDLNKLLNSFKRELKHELHEKQMEKLFPPNGNTIVDTWDLQMIIIVVLKLLHKSPINKKADIRNLRVLQLLRNEVQAHSPSATLDVVKYEDINDQLTDALTSLASDFEENVQEECKLYINKYASGPLDVMSSRECLKQLQNNDVLFQQVLENIEKSKNDICGSLTATQKSLSNNISQQITDLEKNVIERLRRLEAGICRKKIKVGTHVELSLGGPTEEWILLMERTLNDVFNEAYKTSGGKFEDIKKRVEELLQDIKQNTTISFKGSKLKCIILMFECFTYSGLLDLLQYLTSQKYQRRLSALAETLSTHFKVDIPVTATSTISPECLQNALDDLAECEREKHETENCQSHPGDEYKKSIKLAMECSSVEDLVYFWKMFQQGGATHYLDRIADTLSEYSGKKITLSSSINLEEFKEALEDTDGSAVDSGDEINKIPKDLIKDTRTDEDATSDADSLDRFKRSPAASMKRKPVKRKYQRVFQAKRSPVLSVGYGKKVERKYQRVRQAKRSLVYSVGYVESDNDADVGTSKITDSMKDVRIDETDEEESLRSFKRSPRSWQKKPETSFLPSDFLTEMKYFGRERSFQPSGKVSSKTKHGSAVDSGDEINKIPKDLIKDTRIDEDVTNDADSLDRFKRSPAASMKFESAIDADTGVDKLTDLMKDVRIDQDEKDEAESLRPFGRSSTTWMKKDRTDEDKDNLFSSCMISRSA